MPNQPKTPAHTVRIDAELWEATKAEADKQGVTPSDVIRAALRRTLGAVPVIAAMVLLVMFGSRDVAFLGYPPVVDEVAQQQAWAAEVVAEQLTDFGCDTNARLSDTVAVTPFPVKGEHVFDTAVVTVVPFDQAWAQAKAGKVVVQGWCG